MKKQTYTNTLFKSVFLITYFIFPSLVTAQQNWVSQNAGAVMQADCDAIYNGISAVVDFTTNEMAGQNNYNFDIGFINSQTVLNCAIAQNDNFTNCVGQILRNSVAVNDIINQNSTYTYSLLESPPNSNIIVNENGTFEFESLVLGCDTIGFTYQVCDDNTNCCAEGFVQITYFDTEPPSLLDIPENLTIHCDEKIPEPNQVFAVDNCPNIQLDVQERSSQGEDGCSLYDYEISRVWTALDACGNQSLDSQLIEIRDITAPDIFRIYTLPNGKKMVAGVMENVNEYWKTIPFPIDFPTSPLVFSQIISQNEITPALTRIRNVSKSQFELKLQEEEASDQQHLREQVAWVAIEAGGQISSFPLESKTILLSDMEKTINATFSFLQSPNVFANIQTVLDTDPANIRLLDKTTDDLILKIEEETSLDNDTNHTEETVALILIEDGTNLIEQRGDIFGETGTVAVGNNWITVTTAHTYYNPVVIVGPPSNLDLGTGVIQVRNVTPTSFDIQFKEWDHEDGEHSEETVAFMVVEGSVPLDPSIVCTTGTDGLELGKDMVAIDNCDASVSLEYEESFSFSGPVKNIYRTWSSEDECGNEVSISQIVPCEGVAVQIKASLLGALLGSEEEGLMRDDLRKKGLIPIKEPYSQLKNYTYHQGGEILDTALLSIEGDKAIVDWVLVELRDSSNLGNVLDSRAGLIQKNGTVIDANGRDTIVFEHLPFGEYYIAIRHRNHLGVVTLNTYPFAINQIPFIDFTNKFTPVKGSNVQATLDGLQALWAGDLNIDNKIIYQGPNNDIFSMLLEVLLDNNNFNFLPNYIAREYTVNDFNLDGTTIYQGPNNDRSLILFQVLLNHPENNTFLSNFVIQSCLKLN